MLASSDTSQHTTLRAGEAYASDRGVVFRSPKTQETCLLIGFSDIDGTINNEHVPESERLGTIGPARDGVALLQSLGVPVGICTARAQGEAQMYARAIGARGPVISENGACTVYPNGDIVTIGDMREIRQCVAVIEERIGRAVVSTLDLHALEARWAQQQEMGLHVENDLGHATVEALRLSASREASAYLSGLNEYERSVAFAVAESFGFKPFGDLLHLISPRADKGVALDALCARYVGEEVSLYSKDGSVSNAVIDRVTPIVFGNGENDLALFSCAIERGGYGVLVADPVKPSGFHFDVNSKPPHPRTLITPGAPFGHGILAAIPKIVSQLKADYGIDVEGAR